MVAAKPRPDFRAPLAAAVDRDRQVEHDVLSLRKLGLEPLQHLCGSRRGGEQPLLDLPERRELHELLLERAREPAVAEVPAVELLQEARRAPLAELSRRLANEEQQLGDDLLPRRRLGIAV